MFCWAFSIRDLESNESLAWCEGIRYSTYTLYLYAGICMCVRVTLIAICEREKSYVGEVKRNNSVHVIHPNNQPMRRIITHCKHLDTLGEILNCNQCLSCCKYKEETGSARGGIWKSSIAHKGRALGTSQADCENSIFWRYDGKMPAFAKRLIAWARRRFHFSLTLSNWPPLIHGAWHTYSLPVCTHSSIGFSDTLVKWCTGRHYWRTNMHCSLIFSFLLLCDLLKSPLAQMES